MRIDFDRLGIDLLEAYALRFSTHLHFIVSHTALHCQFSLVLYPFSITVVSFPVFHSLNKFKSVRRGGGGGGGGANGLQTPKRIGEVDLREKGEKSRSRY